MRLVFVNDNPEWLQMLLEDARGESFDTPVPKDWDVRGVFSLCEVMGAGADILVIDMSTLTPVMFPQHAQVTDPLCRFLDLHPGATVIISSAMSEYFVREVIEDIETATGQKIAHHVIGNGVCWDDPGGLRELIMQGIT